MRQNAGKRKEGIRYGSRIALAPAQLAEFLRDDAFDSGLTALLMKLAGMMFTEPAFDSNEHFLFEFGSYGNYGSNGKDGSDAFGGSMRIGHFLLRMELAVGGVVGRRGFISVGAICSR